ncbi:hypothetical protein [Aliarcobacter trophiarum]|uniref:hypothetical protein n=1 Tax=Aliarcobacter trophiarum TaxID=708186 RepID=UPI00100AE633|nr:hypothetical protein [Aliarcobacter trophiarum]RXI28613.1 hypothetical protein CRU89_01275 [Aliarcobacter trophiarum]
MLFRAFLSIFFLNSYLFSCASYDDPNEIEYMFLEKRDWFFLEYKDLNNPSVYNSLIYDYEKKNKEENIKEWSIALEKSYSKKDLEEFLYKRKNLDKLKNKEFLNYIKFAQKQEACVTFNYYEPAPKNCGNLIDEAILELEKSEDEYFKLRYFYLAFRLAHYNYKEPLKIYEKYSYLLEKSKPSIVKDWISGINAGALIKNKKEVLGVYEFSKLLDKSKINSHLSFYNFNHIRSDLDFNTLLNMTQNSDEKEKIFFLRALQSSSNTLEELKNIYALNKNSNWFDLLLLRTLINSQLFFNQNSETNFVLQKELLDFLNSVKKDDMYIINLSKAYFNFFENKLLIAHDIVKKLQLEYPNNHEVETLNYILYLNSLQKIDIETENEIFEKMQKLTNDNHPSNAIHNYTFEVILSKLYKNQNEPFLSYGSQNINYLDFSQFDLSMIIEFEEFITTKPNSKLKEYLQEKFKKEKNSSKGDIDYSFETTKVKNLINILKFKEALDTNAPILEEKLEFNPFNGFIRGNNRSGKNSNFTYRNFLKKVLEIENLLKQNPNSSMDNYLLANLYFNLSYFGNSSKATTTHRSVVEIHTPILQEDKLHKALRHYQIALANSKDKEQKAKIIYQISKTNLAIYDLKYSKYPQSSSSYFSDNKQKYYYGLNSEFYESFLSNSGAKYFDELKNNYKDTKYYKELLKECGDFRTYINSEN